MIFKEHFLCGAMTKIISSAILSNKECLRRFSKMHEFKEFLVPLNMKTKFKGFQEVAQTLQYNRT